jgi:spore coat protein U-like protein
MRRAGAGVRVATTIAVTSAAFGVLEARVPQSRTATLKVSAHVAADCIVTATDLRFGDYDPVGIHRTQPLDATATLSVVCTRGTIAAIDLDDGRTGGRTGAGTTRAMAGPGNRVLAYDIYREAARQTRWGRLAGGVSLPAATSTAARTLDVYGRVPPNQDVPIGAYADEVLVTIRF